MYSFCGHDDKFDVRNTCLLKLGTTIGQVLVLSKCQCYVGLSTENGHSIVQVVEGHPFPIRPFCFSKELMSFSSLCCCLPRKIHCKTLVSILYRCSLGLSIYGVERC